MKKTLCMFLVLCMIFSMTVLTAFAADKPQETDEASAGVMVTTDTEGASKSYFESLTPEVIKWACAELTGNRVITLLKDLDVSTEGTATVCLEIPGTLAGWSNTDRGKLSFDLNNHTLSYTGEGNMFSAGRWTPSFRNGTILYTSTGATPRNIVAIGTTTGATAISDGKEVYKPVLTFDNVHAYNLSDKGLGIVRSSLYATQIQIRNNSFLWSANGDTIRIEKTDQTKNVKTPYAGAFEPSIKVADSVVASGTRNAISCKVEGLTVDLHNATLASEAGKVLSDPFAGELFTNGLELKEQSNWSATLKDGTVVKGTAHVYSDESLASFTDVAEGTWYYTYVTDLAKAGVINGMTETTFVPDGNLTYGQALKLITLAVGEAEAEKTSSHWASGYVSQAKAYGWLDVDVNPDQNINRLQFCQIAAKAKGMTEQPATNPFTDTSDPSVLALYKANIINGMTDTTFQPTGLLTRAQIAKIIWTMGH